MLSRFTRRPLLLTLTCGLLLAHPDLLRAEDIDLAERPVVRLGKFVSIQSGADVKQIILYERQYVTIQFNKRIRTVSGFDASLLEIQNVEPQTILIKSGRNSGQTTLVIKDESDTLTKVLIIVKSKTIEKLRETLEELFPDTKLQLMELSDSILIRGTVSTTRDSIHVAEIANQYYPQVLNHLAIKVNPDAAKAAVPKSNRAGTADLQSDIRALHADVKQLIELLEQRRSSIERFEPADPEDDQASRGKLEYHAPSSHIAGRDTRANAADARVPRGTFSGVVRVIGEVPRLPPLVRAEDLNSRARECTDEAIPDESLLVGANNGLANVFVFLPKLTSGVKLPDDASLEPIALTSRACRFHPHCSIVRVGQKVQLNNEDPSLSNYHFYPLRNSAVNMAVAPNDRSGPTIGFKRPEIQPIKIGDDIHPWKRAYQLVVDHPFAALTDEEGRFQIEGLPPGEYNFQIWHERVGYIDKDYRVTVGEAGSADVEILLDVATLLAQDESSTKTGQKTAPVSDASPAIPRKVQPSPRPRQVTPPARPRQVKPARAVQEADSDIPLPKELPQGRYGMFFYADWASKSRELWALVRDVARQKGVKVHGLDVGREEHQKLARQLGVTELPTLLLIDDRKVIGRIVDLASGEDVREVIRRLQSPHYDIVWSAIGLRLRPQSPADGEDVGPDTIREGMLITEVRDGFPRLAQTGLREGDILVGLGISKATTIGHVHKALMEDSRTDDFGTSWITFHAVRDGETLQGELWVATTKEDEEASADAPSGADESVSFGSFGERPEVMFFQASWCGPCQVMAPMVKSLAAERILPIRTIDVDADRAVAERFGVTSLPTFVLRHGDSEMGRLIGATSEKAIRELMQQASHLPEQQAWLSLGLHLLPLALSPAVEFNSGLRGGMQIVGLRDAFPYPQQAGLRQGDILIDLGNQETNTFDDLHKLFTEGLPTDKPFPFQVVRNGQVVSGELRVAKIDEQEDPPAVDARETRRSNRGRRSDNRAGDGVFAIGKINNDGAVAADRANTRTGTNNVPISSFYVGFTR